MSVTRREKDAGTRGNSRVKRAFFCFSGYYPLGASVCERARVSFVSFDRSPSFPSPSPSAQPDLSTVYSTTEAQTPGAPESVGSSHGTPQAQHSPLRPPHNYPQLKVLKRPAHLDPPVDFTMTKEIMESDSTVKVIQAMRGRVKTKPGLFRGMFPCNSTLSRNGYMSPVDIQRAIDNLGFQKTTSQALLRALGLPLQTDHVHIGDLMQALTSESLGESLDLAEWQHAKGRAKQLAHRKRLGQHLEAPPAPVISKHEMEVTASKSFADVQTSREWWASRTHVPDGICAPSPRRMFTAEEGFEVLSNKVNMSSSVRPLFVTADDNNSGAIELDDLKSLMAKMSMPMTDDEVLRLMAMFDADHNGSIEYGEWNGTLKDPAWSKEWESELAMSMERSTLYEKCVGLDGADKLHLANRPDLTDDLDPISAKLNLGHPRHIFKLVLDHLEVRFGTVGAAFRALDTDGTQSLSLTELKLAIHNLGLLGEGSLADHLVSENVAFSCLRRSPSLSQSPHLLFSTFLFFIARHNYFLSCLDRISL
jgi:hypothetical protein